MVLFSIPSPSEGTFDLGPFALHMYGLMLLLAIAACVVLTGLRWTRFWAWRPDRSEIGQEPPHDFDLVLRVAVWGVAAGVVGARLYHVVTSWSEIPEPKWQGVFEVWRGGLGVWGGILFGTLVGAVIVRRAGYSVRLFLDAAAPGLLVAHGIGRWGNWWNQELFGEPTGRPWGLEIDPENRPDRYVQSETFHPTFLYESLYTLGMAAVLVWIGWRFRIRPPALFALYVAVYTFGRFFEELLRIDPAHELGPLRLNAWVSLVVFVSATAFFIWWQFMRPRREDRPRPAAKGPTMAIPKRRVRPSR
ncbi:MAG: prolipoprotein diacylglyceryl transferase [Gaiellaceae bacterium]